RPGIVVAGSPAMLILLFSALAGCQATDTVAPAGAAITGGEPEHGYPAVFSLAFEGQGGCTGTCVTSRVGTTAAHCIGTDPASAFTGLFGDDEVSPERIIGVSA